MNACPPYFCDKQIWAGAVYFIPPKGSRWDKYKIRDTIY